MKLHIHSLAAAITLGLSAAQVSAVEVILVPWNQTWDYLHPMGTDPAIADTDFNTTWFQNAADFATNYNGPAIGGPTVAGNAGNPASFDSGSGPSPLGYGAADYFATAGAELTAMGRTLTTPTSASRYTGYFRTTFTTTQAYTSPRIRMLLDDGALVYLDGVLVARVNKADNTAGYTQLSADSTATLNETGASSNNETCIQSFFLSTAGGSTRADSTVVVPISSISAGTHTLAVAVCNSANTSSDLVMGLQLLANDAGLSALASNLQRQDNGPGFADDTFSFDVVVTPQNMPGATSWTSNNAPARGPVTGSYAPTVYSYSYPAQVDSGSPTQAIIEFTDTTDPLLKTTLSVTAPAAPAGPPLLLSAATPSIGTGFEEATLGLGNFSRRIFNTELGFTSSGAVVQDKLANINGSKMLSFANALAAMTTEAVPVDPAVPGIAASVTMRAYTTSTTGFEVDDTLRISVESSPDGLAWTDIGSVVPLLSGPDPARGNIDQFLIKTGPGVAGPPALRSRLGWAAAGMPTPATDTLDVPAFNVPDAEPLEVSVSHRYSFEYDGTRWDGGAIQVAINGGGFTQVPGTSITQGGYDGIITGTGVLDGLEGFNGDSPGYSDGAMITTIFTVAGLNPGDSVQIRFVGAWDELTVSTFPNWEINGVTVKSGATTLYEETFATGNGAFTGSTGWAFDDGTLRTGPSYYTFSRSALPLPAGHQFVRMKLAQTGVALSTSEYILIDHVKLEVGLPPLADADADGISNALEDLAGTNPADPLSAFRIAQSTITSPDDPTFQRTTFAFTGPELRTYRFQCSENLTAWTDLDTRYGDPATPDITFSNDASSPAKFWRLSISY